MWAESTNVGARANEEVSRQTKNRVLSFTHTYVCSKVAAHAMIRELGNFSLASQKVCSWLATQIIGSMHSKLTHAHIAASQRTRSVWSWNFREQAFPLWPRSVSVTVLMVLSQHGSTQIVYCLCWRCWIIFLSSYKNFSGQIDDWLTLGVPFYACR